MTYTPFIAREREKFEAAWRELGWRDEAYYAPSIVPGNYALESTEFAWRAWLARARDVTVTDAMVERARVQMVKSGLLHIPHQSTIKVILTAALQPGEE